MMPPLAHSAVSRALPTLTDFDGARTKLEMEAGRRVPIERKHLVVRVTPERLVNHAARKEEAVVAHPDFVHGLRLDHEMVDPLELPSTEGQRMMSRVGVHEGDVDFVSEVLAPDVVTQLQPEHRRVECFVLVLVLRGHHDVSEALLVGHETRVHDFGYERLFALLGAVEDLVWIPRWVVDTDECLDVSPSRFVRSALRNLVPGVPEALPYGVALVLVGMVLVMNSISIAFRMYLRGKKKW